MKAHIILLLLTILASCSSNSNTNKAEVVISDTITNNADSSIAVDYSNSQIQAASEMATYYLLIADTGLSYNLLHDKMFLLNKTFKLAIDTMGRYFNLKKNLIALPDNDEDEMYAGNYFPKRFPTVTLSLEYLKYYQPNAGEKTIALMAGIYESKNTADSALTGIKNKEDKAFILKADIYLGDEH